MTHSCRVCPVIMDSSNESSAAKSEQAGVKRKDGLKLWNMKS